MGLKCKPCGNRIEYPRSNHRSNMYTDHRSKEYNNYAGRDKYDYSKYRTRNCTTGYSNSREYSRNDCSNKEYSRNGYSNSREYSRNDCSNREYSRNGYSDREYSRGNRSYNGKNIYIENDNCDEEMYPYYGPPCHPLGFYGGLNCCPPCPNICFEVQQITTTQGPSGNYVHEYTILFKTTTCYSPSYCGLPVKVTVCGSSVASCYILFRCTTDQTITFRYSSANQTPGDIRSWYEECGRCCDICGTQGPVTCSITGTLFESNPQPSGVTTINVMLTNTGTTTITGVTFDIPQPINTSNYIPGLNFQEINTPTGTVMRFGPIDIPVGNTPVTGSFTVTQNVVGSYQWSAIVQATSCTPNLTLSLTTTVV